MGLLAEMVSEEQVRILAGVSQGNAPLGILLHKCQPTPGKRHVSFLELRPRSGQDEKEAPRRVGALGQVPAPTGR